MRDALSAPIRITVGDVGAANTDIKQTVEVQGCLCVVLRLLNLMHHNVQEMLWCIGKILLDFPL